MQDSQIVGLAPFNWLAGQQVGCDDEQSRLPGIERERQMIVRPAARRRTIRFVAAEKPRQLSSRTDHSLHAGHDGAAECAGDRQRFCRQKASLDCEDEQPHTLLDGPHYTQSQEATVAKGERACHTAIEGDFDVPHPLLREARSGREQLRPLATEVKGFPLNTNGLSARSHIRVTQRLLHGLRGARVLGCPLSPGPGLSLYSRRIDTPAPRCLWKCRRSDGPPDSGWIPLRLARL